MLFDEALVGLNEENGTFCWRMAQALLREEERYTFLLETMISLINSRSYIFSL